MARGTKVCDEKHECADCEWEHNEQTEKAEHCRERNDRRPVVTAAAIRALVTTRALEEDREHERWRDEWARGRPIREWVERSCASLACG